MSPKLHYPNNRIIIIIINVKLSAPPVSQQKFQAPALTPYY